MFILFYVDSRFTAMALF